MNDYRVAEAQMKLDMLREAPEQDPDAIKVAEEALKVAIELRNITSEGKRKGGLCGKVSCQSTCKSGYSARVTDNTQLRSKPQ